MTTSAEAILTILETARGARPYSLEDRETEQVFNVALALLVELAASNDRIDRLERLLAEATGRSLDDLRSGEVDVAAQAERQEAMEALLLRVLRVVIDPRPPIDGRPKARGLDHLNRA